MNQVVTLQSHGKIEGFWLSNHQMSLDSSRQAFQGLFTVNNSYRQARSYAGIVFTQWSKNVFFAPQERHVAPINVKFGTVERSAPPCQISRLSGQKYGNTAPKLSKFGILPQICPSLATCLHNFYEIISVCTRLYSFQVFNLVAFWGQTTKL